MKIKLLWLGRSKDKSFEHLIDLYDRRLSHYCSHEIVELKEVKGVADPETLKKREAELLLKNIQPQDFVVLMDERGRQLSSIGLSEFLQDKMNQSLQRMTFIIGGAFGVDSSVSQRANYTWSLSKLTFTHDMARVVLIEQLYRAFTIQRGEKYHNE